MQKDFLHKLINWPKYFITGTDLRFVLPGTDNTRKAIIKRAIHEGYLQRLKRDLYLIKNIDNKALINSFEISQFIYGPSYISLESALSNHGWIPEAVPVICSATIKKTKTFNTSIASFSFEKVPNKIFSLGVAQVEENNSYFLIAAPWKAIADMIYCRKKHWKNVSELMGDLRIEFDSISQSDFDLLATLSEEYPHKLTRTVLNNIRKSITQLKNNSNEN